MGLEVTLSVCFAVFSSIDSGRKEFEGRKEGRMGIIQL